MLSDARSNKNGFMSLPEQENIRQAFFFYFRRCKVGSWG